MGENSAIEWTHHTFNPWRGCTKVSAGCTNCYAEKLSHRNPGVLGIWGDGGTRVVASEAAWREPLKWDRKAGAAGERHRVFCASLADVFEDRPELVEPRGRLFTLIGETPNLDWLLLTKRPEGWEDRLHEVVQQTHDGGDVLASYWLDGDAPQNVWLGTSVENRVAAYLRIHRLQDVPATVRFLSIEPLLEDVWTIDLAGIGWVIVGGESGPHARPMHPDWARSIRDQCREAGVPFLFKQWGEWVGSDDDVARDWPVRHEAMKEAGKVHVWPYKKPSGHPYFGMDFNLRVGKKAAGRMLDGRTWDEFPTPVATAPARPADLPGQAKLF